MAIVDQLDYLWVKFSHAMVGPVVKNEKHLTK